MFENRQLDRIGLQSVKRHMKKTLCLLLALLLFIGCFAGCAGKYPATAEGPVFSGNAGDAVAVEPAFDPTWITRADDTVYNKKLAAFAALLSADSYFREKDLATGTQNRVLLDNADGEYDFTSFLRAVGFTDVRHIESFHEKEYAGDDSDSVTMTLGYRRVSGTDVYAVVIRGCFSTREWVSSFDLGFDGASYTALTGEHPEWTDAGLLKGVGVTANRAEELIREFMAEHGDPETPDSIFLTGHSRGGTIAGVLGARFEDGDFKRTYTYAFNPMPVTNDEQATEYKTVFNIFDSGDFYSSPFPFGTEKLYRFGSDVSACMADSQKLRDAVAALKGRSDYNCLPAAEKSAYDALFAGLFPDRASLYEEKTLLYTYDSADAAKTQLDAFRTVIGAEAGLDLGLFCRPGDVEKTSDGKYAVSLSYCSAAFLLGYAKVLAYGSAAYDAFASLFAGVPDACRIAQILSDNLPAISAGHLLINSYVLAAAAKPR